MNVDPKCAESHVLGFGHLESSVDSDRFANVGAMFDTSFLLHSLLFSDARLSWASLKILCECEALNLWVSVRPNCLKTAK